MLVQSFWLSSLLFILSVTAHTTSITSIYPPADLKRRYLSTGTAVSLPSTAVPPYPTGSANGTSVPIGSIAPTSSILPSGCVSSCVFSKASTSTAAPSPTPSAFYLVVADTGTPFDGDYIYVGMDNEDDGLYLGLFDGLKEPVANGGSVFSLSVDGTLLQVVSGLVASYFDMYGDFIFQYPDALESSSETAATCKIVAGALICQNGAIGVFSAVYQPFVDELHPIPSLNLGPTVSSEASLLTLLVVPV